MNEEKINARVKELVSKENNRKFQQAMKKLAEEIAQGKTEPLDAYHELIHYGRKIFPKNFDDPRIQKLLYQRFQVYLSIWILSRLAKLFRNLEEVHGTKFTKE